jgi:hypothetical protein
MEIPAFSLLDLPPAWCQKVWPLVLKNTEPPHYLVGGAIARTLINKMYGSNLEIRNYDFAVGSLSQNPQLGNGWMIKSNSFGNWKIVTGDPTGIHIDVWPFANWKRP